MKLPVIEFTGAGPCSGKTRLLYHIITLTLLPIAHNGNLVGGKDEAVVLFDLDNRFCLLGVRESLLSYLRSLQIPLHEEDYNILLRSSLQHLHIFRPQSTQAFLATVGFLTTYFTDTQNHISANRAVGVLALNGLSAFLWQDRLDGDEAGLVNISNGRENNDTFAQKYRDLVVALGHVQQAFETTVIATNWGLAPISHSAGHPVLRPHLPTVWTNFCSLRVVIERDTVSKFGPAMSAEEAMMEGHQRQEAVDNSGFSCWINWWGSDNWREEFKEEVSRMERSRALFRFRIEAGRMVIKC